MPIIPDNADNFTITLQPEHDVVGSSQACRNRSVKSTPQNSSDLCAKLAAQPRNIFLTSSSPALISIRSPGAGQNKLTSPARISPYKNGTNHINNESTLLSVLTTPSKESVNGLLLDTSALEDQWTFHPTSNNSHVDNVQSVSSVKSRLPLRITSTNSEVCTKNCNKHLTGEGPASSPIANSTDTLYIHNNKLSVKASPDSDMTCETSSDLGISSRNGPFGTTWGATSEFDREKQKAPLYNLCHCPCLSCGTCPLRALPAFRGARNSGTGLNPAEDNIAVAESPPSGVSGCFRKLFSPVVTGFSRFYSLEAAADASKYSYDTRIIPPVPLAKSMQTLLMLTELPFLILWVYFTYWIVIVSIAAPKAPSTVWLSAAVAGILVGIGLNANAYKLVTVPRRRGSIRHHRHARALLEMKKYGESMDVVEMKIDWGMITRFFIIPFGVSSLSGLTNFQREAFLLVFPRDPTQFAISFALPSAVCFVLFMSRILLLWKLRVRWSVEALFLNGALVD